MLVSFFHRERFQQATNEAVEQIESTAAETMLLLGTILKVKQNFFQTASLKTWSQLSQHVGDRQQISPFVVK